MIVAQKLYCALCGQSEDDAKCLLAGPEVNVCDQCILGMAEILASQYPEWRDMAIERLTKAHEIGPLPSFKREP
jgi:ATP-dependent protease Clp ATPase subunit